MLNVIIGYSELWKSSKRAPRKGVGEVKKTGERALLLPAPTAIQSTASAEPENFEFERVVDNPARCFAT
jgi:hypothetical protein